MGGANIGSFTATAGTNSENLSVGNSNLSGNEGGTVYALSVKVNDTTNSTHSSTLPFDIVIDALDSNTITLHGLGSLGIAASTPTIVYGLGGEGGDTINATGMTANVWFVGGEGAETMTGGSGINTYLYADQSDSPLGGADEITNFHAGTDVLNFSAISGVTSIQGLITGNTSIAANSIAWKQAGSETDVFVNPTGSAHGQTNLSLMEIALSGVTASTLSSAQFCPDRWPGGRRRRTDQPGSDRSDDRRASGSSRLCSPAFRPAGH